MRAALAIAFITAAGLMGWAAWRSRSSTAVNGGAGSAAPDLWGLLNEGADSSELLPAPSPAAAAASESPSIIDWFLDMTKPRGIRNNNPGNVKRSGSAWLGKVPSAQNTDATFEQFTAPVYGIRVIAYLLLKYQRDKGKRTIRALISEPGGWAPSNTDNNPAGYATAIARAVNLRETDTVDLFASDALLTGITTAIIKFENGQQPYSAEVIGEGVRMARAAF